MVTYNSTNGSSRASLAGLSSITLSKRNSPHLHLLY